MKKTILSIHFVLLCAFVQAQTKSYIVLDSAHNPNLNYSHVVSEYHGFPIETFNIFPGDTSLEIYLLNVIPSFENPKIEWEAIDLKKISKNIISIDSLKKYTQKKYWLTVSECLDFPEKYPMKLRAYLPVVKKNNKYYIPKTEGAIEFFIDDDIMFQGHSTYYEHILHTKHLYFMFDTKGQKINIDKFEAAYVKKYGIQSKNSSYNPSMANFANLYLNLLIRANDTTFNGKTAYRFWTLGQPNYDGDGFERGIERFTYVPDYGIIAGAYATYFLDFHKYKRYPAQIKKKTIYFNPVKPHTEYDYFHNIQSTPLRIELNGKVVYDKNENKN